MSGIEGWLEPTAIAVASVVIFVGLAQSGVYFVQLCFAGWALARRPPVSRFNLLWRRYGEVSPPISVLVPAYNEEVMIVECLRALLALEYPSFEVVIVNDGSKDATLERIIDAYGLSSVARIHDTSLTHQKIRGLYASPRHPSLVVIDKENGGRADALNAGINLARAPLVCVIDADSLLESDALLRAVRPFVDDPARMVAVGGTIRIANGSHIASGRVTDMRLPRNPLALFQIVEYLRAFLMARIGWSEMGALTIISGAFGLFRRADVIAVGGYSPTTVGEDFEIVMKLHRYLQDSGRDYRVSYIPEPVCWTEVPESLASLGHQRARWQRGALEVFFKHRGMAFRSRYGRVGWIGYGNMLLADVLGPVVEVLGYVLVPTFWWFGLLNWPFFLAFLAVTFIYGVFLSVAALVLEDLGLGRFPRARHLLALTIVAVLENFGYRQLNNLWRLRGWWQFLRRDHGWGTMTRVGFRQS